MLRNLILGVANQPLVRRVATGGPGRRVALRFVAGENLDQGFGVTRALCRRGFSVALDHLGENVMSADAADAAAAVYREAIERIAAEGLDATVTLKPTQMGLDIDEGLAHANVAKLCAAAASSGSSLALDMEDHRYTERTIAMCLRLDAEFPGRAGIALQSALYRTPADLDRVIGVPVRIVKGAYREPPEFAYPRKADVDRAFAQIVARLMREGAYPMIATHDERLIRYTLRRARQYGRSPDTFEFQMLYGIGRNLQQRLLDQGYRVRVYVPFGSDWYPYLIRRLAERPANLAFFLAALARG
ncbi:MAG TPA: proline dehydrogenase family protein [Actinomycetota bacterium]|nr:proline dehydrogenase family protein [Actinomycetota bacterium]